MRVCMIAKFSVSESMRVSMTMSFRDHRASSRLLGTISVFVYYMRVHVILRVRDNNQVKLTICTDTDKNLMYVFCDCK